MIRDLNINVTVTRTLTLTGRTFDVTSPSPPVKFVGSLDLPRAPETGNDGSPRQTHNPYLLRWRQGPLGVGDQDVLAGFGLTLSRPVAVERGYENELYEVLTNPRLVRNGHLNWAMQAEVLPQSILYPYSATLKEQDGTTIDTVPVALWSAVETHRDTGTYEDFDGEAPIEYESVLVPNNSLWIGDLRYRIVSSITDLAGPRVTFVARRSNA